jgi:hypothetical protein
MHGYVYGSVIMENNFLALTWSNKFWRPVLILVGHNKEKALFVTLRSYYSLSDDITDYVKHN